MLLALAVLDANGPVAATQAQLLRDVVLLLGLVVVPVFVMVLVVILRFRHGRQGPYHPEWHRSRRLEVVVWGVPAVVVVATGFLIATRTVALDPYRQVGEGEILDVQAISMDWRWLFLYPGDGVASVNRLVIPAGRPVRIALTSASVMTSFFIPGLAGQVFAMGGMRTELNLRADAPRQMWGRNTQYSGAGFAQQAFTVEVTDEAGFAAWRDAARGADALDRDAYARLAASREASPPSDHALAATGLFESVVQRGSGAGP